ncbi:rhodanese domain-containing protein [Alcanivorax hongdengensis A-11-3]|uniref:Rhodanese domain-containing protein n=1 Tax=Alcanivorax hongdengensis A-11-3 TaxID=1177179 RepID=L0WI41_9GAMM|nr:rhodanese-like domain-containing protein [Alcanivorax hongdengensis]EKF75827.1 rhodanese domain-containing protein [Alcanivorax hongdengensis A-11-3]
MKRLVLIATLLTGLASMAWAADTISVDDLAGKMAQKQGPVVIDVRNEDEFLAGHIPGAIMIPQSQIGANLEMLKAHKKEPIVVYCRSGARAAKAAAELEEAGFKKVEVLDGSFQAWQAAGKPVTK